MPVKLTIEVEGPVTDEDRAVLANAAMALFAITNTLIAPDEEENKEEATEEEPPPLPVVTTFGKEVN